MITARLSFLSLGWKSIYPCHFFFWYTMNEEIKLAKAIRKAADRILKGLRDEEYIRRLNRAMDMVRRGDE